MVGRSISQLKSNKNTVKISTNIKNRRQKKNKRKKVKIGKEE